MNYNAERGKFQEELKKNTPDYLSLKNSLLSWYYNETGRQKHQLYELSRDDLDEIVKWINKKEFSREINLHRQNTIIEKVFYQSLASKVSSLSQAHCPFCTQDYPISVINIRIRPQSYQALDSELKNAFKKAVRSKLAAKTSSEFRSSRICIHVIFVCSKGRPEKDVDNMSKILLDSIKDVLMGDDSEIDHLSVMKIRNPDDEEFTTINIRKSRLNDEECQLSPFLHHSWGGAVMLELNDFL
jgi:Holliday junction resolvase RusA-like endonuclease